MVRIRPAGPADLDALARLEAVSFVSSWNRKSLAAELDQPTSVFLLLEEQGNGNNAANPVAYLCARLLPPEAELLRIAVAPAARRRGYGRRLLERLLVELCRHSITVLHLEVSAANSAALKFYETLGFSPTGRRPGYYDQGRTAARLLTLIMQ